MSSRHLSFFLLTVGIVVHMIVEGAEDAITLVTASVVLVVVTIHVIETGVPLIAEDIHSYIVLVEMHVIMVVTDRVIIAAVVLALLVVVELAEIVPERVLTVVLVPPTQEIVSSFLFVF